MPAEMRTALQQREHLIEQRARALLKQALTERATWTSQLGPPPTNPRQRQAWLRHASTVAAYRDRHAVTATTPLGGPPSSYAQRVDVARAGRALQGAQRVAALAEAFREGPVRRQGHERPGMVL